MRIATMRHFDAFSKAVRDIAEQSSQYADIALGTNEVMRHNVSEGNVDGALLAGVTATVHLGGEYHRLMVAFKAATFDLFGESPRTGESDGDFFERISTMEVNSMFAMARRNGVNIRF